MAEAKNLINSGNEEEGSFNLLRVFRGIPKNKALIKYLASPNGLRIYGNWVFNDPET